VLQCELIPPEEVNTTVRLHEFGVGYHVWVEGKRGFASISILSNFPVAAGGDSSNMAEYELYRSVVKSTGIHNGLESKKLGWQVIDETEGIEVTTTMLGPVTHAISYNKVDDLISVAETWGGTMRLRLRAKSICWCQNPRR
jgi:hypothetical protein